MPTINQLVKKSRGKKTRKSKSPVLNVGFNKEVAEDAAIYWTKQSGDLAKIIEKADALSKEAIAEYGEKAKNRVKEAYSWELICGKYEKIFVER